MTRLDWSANKREIQYGVERCVLYPKDAPGVQWQGVEKISLSPENTDLTAMYHDGIARNQSQLMSSLSITLSAYTYPDEFLEFDLAEENWQEPLKEFDLCWTSLGMDDTRYLHLLYNCQTVPSDAAFSTIDDSTVTPMLFSWNIACRPEKVKWYSPAAHFVLDSSMVLPENYAAATEILYGTDESDPRMPSVEELLELFAVSSLIVIDHGDGSYTVEGPDDMVTQPLDGVFKMEAPSLVHLDGGMFRVSSY